MENKKYYKNPQDFTNQGAEQLNYRGESIFWLSNLEQYNHRPENQEINFFDKIINFIINKKCASFINTHLPNTNIEIEDIRSELLLECFEWKAKNKIDFDIANIDLKMKLSNTLRLKVFDLIRASKFIVIPRSTYYEKVKENANKPLAEQKNIFITTESIDNEPIEIATQEEQDPEVAKLEAIQELKKHFSSDEINEIIELKENRNFLKGNKKLFTKVKNLKHKIKN